MAGDELTLSQDASDEQMVGNYFVTYKTSLLLVHLTDTASVSEHEKVEQTQQTIAFFLAPAPISTLECTSDKSVVHCENDEVLQLHGALAILPIVHGLLCIDLVDSLSIFLIQLSSCVFFFLSHVACICCDICCIYFETSMSAEWCCCILLDAAIMNLVLSTLHVHALIFVIRPFRFVQVTSTFISFSLIVDFDPFWKISGNMFGTTYFRTCIFDKIVFLAVCSTLYICDVVYFRHNISIQKCN